MASATGIPRLKFARGALADQTACSSACSWSLRRTFEGSISHEPDRCWFGEGLTYTIRRTIFHAITTALHLLYAESAC